MEVIKTDFQLLKLEGTLLNINLQGRKIKIPAGPLCMFLGIVLFLSSSLVPKEYTLQIAFVGLIFIIAAMILFNYKPRMMRE